MFQILFKIATSVADRRINSSIDAYRILGTSLYQLYFVFWRSSVQTSAPTLAVLTELFLFGAIFRGKYRNNTPRSLPSAPFPIRYSLNVI